MNRVEREEQNYQNRIKEVLTRISDEEQRKIKL